MTKVGVLVCLVIVAMDAVAGILGIKAEVAKNKVIHMRQMKNSGCKEPSPEAYMLGLVAAALQALTHIIANLLGGCMCICCTEDLERSSANRQFWFTCLILSCGSCLEGECCAIGNGEDNGLSPEIFVVQSDVQFDSGAIPEISAIGNVVLHIVVPITVRALCIALCNCIVARITVRVQKVRGESCEECYEIGKGEDIGMSP
ncbi:hypothetical protein LWI29_007906 [Acer saccharum]|uniref:Uncharacterized protein n=1 Tax=Acer saccharum TaxID=4024 RepID=A0AA39W0L9_ACESA|nr:hypothetical protein LWI29_007906 [Acer saccharum]